MFLVLQVKGSRQQAYLFWKNMIPDSFYAHKASKNLEHLSERCSQQQTSIDHLGYRSSPLPTPLPPEI